MNDDIPVLAGDWITTTEAAKMLGVSRQHSWRMAVRKKWKTVHRIGNSDVYVVKRSEVEQKMAARKV